VTNKSMWNNIFNKDILKIVKKEFSPTLLKIN